MKSLLIGLVALLCVCAGAVWTGEHWDANRAEAAMRSGDAKGAYQRFTALTTRRLWFLDARDLASRRERAAAAGLPVLLREHHFDAVRDLIAVVLAGPETGYEIDARAVQAVLSQDHLRYTRDLLAAGRNDEALAVAAATAELYRGQPRVIEEFTSLKVKAQMALARQAFASGDAVRVVNVLADIEETAPSVERLQAVPLVADSVAQRAEWHVRQRDFPGLLAWLQTGSDTLARRPDLQRAARRVYRDYVHGQFNVPVGDVPDALDVEVLPAIAPVSATGRGGFAHLVVANRSETPLWVVLRGPQDYRTDTPIRPGESVRIAARPGRYAEAVYSWTTNPMPYLGVIELAAVEYAQNFVIQERGGISGAAHARAFPP